MVNVNNSNWTLSLIGMLIERLKQYYMNSCKSPKNFILSKIRKIKNQPLQKSYIYATTLSILNLSHELTLFTFIYIAPDDPTGMRGITEKASTTSVYIEWDESPPTTCDRVTWYELSYTMDKTCTCSVTNITTNNTRYNLTELLEYTTLYITLVAVNAVGKSAGHANTTITDQSNINLFIIFIILNVYEYD